MSEKIQFFSEKVLGPMKPVNGICNGPLCMGGYVDLSAQYKELAVPYVRLHDTDYPYPQQVDVYQIFRDFDADPDDPDNYDFLLTDQFITAIVNVGARIIYRLGTSIEHMKKQRWVHPPKPEVFAKVCAGIIRHYNCGWANGFHYNIQYWEIWNEPEDFHGARKQMWTGTPLQMYELYDITAQTLRKEFGNTIKIGAFATIGFYIAIKADDNAKMLDEYISDFLKYAKEHRSPIDFMPFHYYGNHPEYVYKFADYARNQLAEAGYTDIELVLDEWNMFFDEPQTFLDISSMPGARHCAKMLMALQKSGVDIASYYDGQPQMPWCGLFSRELIKQKPFYVFYLYSRMYRLGKQIEASSSNGLEILAASDENTVGLWLINEGESEMFEITTPFSQGTMYTIDAVHDLKEAPIDDSHTVKLSTESVIYIELKK